MPDRPRYFFLAPASCARAPRLGLLTVAVGWSTERALTVMAKKMVKGNAGSPMPNSLLKIARCAAADMVHFAGEFGMTPRARSYLDDVWALYQVSMSFLA